MIDIEENNGLVEEGFDDYLNSNSVEQVTDNKLLNYALHYAKCGYPVIRLQHVIPNGILNDGKAKCSCRNGENCSSVGKHPSTRNGSNDATTDENIILDWWEKKPFSNVGLLTGKESGFFVLDVDVRTNYEDGVYSGEVSLEDLQEHYRHLMGMDFDSVATLSSISGSGGRHFYLKYTPESVIQSSTSKIDTGLDIKSDGGFIIAPPSNHISGKEYKWFGVNTSIEDAPEWLHYEIQLLQKEKHELKSKSVKKQSVNKGEIIKTGERNNYLFPEVCTWINYLPKNEVIEKAMKVNQEKFEKPLTNREILNMINWCWDIYILKKSHRSLGMKK